MMSRTRMCWLALLSAMLLIPAAAPAQEKKDAEKKGPPNLEEMNKEMQAWMEAGRPNENHKRLNDMIGDWKCSVKMWQPGMPATQSSGTCTNQWVLQNRYVHTTYKGNMMGMPFEGAAITGYDNINKRYFSTWMDTMSTGMMVEYGQYDEKAKTYTYTGEFDNPMGGKMSSKSEIKVLSKDKHILTIHHGEDAKSLKKVMEITYERKAGGGETASAMKTVETGCGSCIFGMPVRGCKLAVKIDGKPYLVRGANVNAHNAGLCRGAKQAQCSGEVKDNVFLAKSFKLVE
ncbi:MAG: DUF1579 domain-containing protein [Phycisphaerales bacterium]|nr:DUF1579 domain-containing protein [Phycisphaerales bacterium]